MIFRKTLSVGKDHKLVIELPDEFPENEKVTVTVEENNGDMSDKKDWLQMAASDPLFLADIEEISKDFESSDKENP